MPSNKFTATWTRETWRAYCRDWARRNREARRLEQCCYICGADVTLFKSCLACRLKRAAYRSRVRHAA